MERKRSALVTGAASGIGRGIVEYLRGKGDHVFACDISERGLDGFRGVDGVTADPGMSAHESPVLSALKAKYRGRRPVRTMTVENR
jgi:NAD(P)-dependent dehydrogenase (short-subunit alcohol dehydrogenase family)